MRIDVRVLAWVAIAPIVFISTDTYAQVCPDQDTSNTFNDVALGALVPSPSTGIVYDSVGGHIEVAKESGTLSSVASDATLGWPYFVATAADIDGDGWDDLVKASRITQRVTYELNDTDMNAAPVDWSTSGTERVATFTPANIIYGATGLSASLAIVGGDFTGDGSDDVVRVAANDTDDAINLFDIFVNDPVDCATSTSAVAPSTTVAPGCLNAPVNAFSGAVANLGYLKRSSSAMVATDWNGDNCLDILLATDSTVSDIDASGQVFVMINDCTGMFTEIQLLSGLDFDGEGGGTEADNGGSSVAFGDFNGDGFPDIVASAVSAATLQANALQIYLSDGAGGFGSKTPVTIIGADDAHAQGLFVADFNQDRLPDIAWTIDDSHAGARDGNVGVILNDGVGHPFDTGAPSYFDAGLADLDSGTLIDYDQDPQGTLDIFVGDASAAAGANFMLVNRVAAPYAECGELTSNVLGTTLAAGTEYVITAARFQVTESLPAGTSIRYFASNVTPPLWVEATPCTLAPNSDYCVMFPSSAGTTLRWKIEMCSDGTQTSTPELSQLDVVFDYIEAATHFRSGVVTSNGVVYAGGFGAPGDRGKFSAVSTDFSSATVFWSVEDELDSGNPLVSDRKIYTADRSTGNVRINFVTGTSTGSDTLPETLNVASGTIADTLVNWWHTQRFGAAAPFSRLGAIVNSTAAVLTAPGLPVHYSFLVASEQTAVDAFISTHATREDIVLFGSKDGAVHAVRTNPTTITLGGAADNGKEEWAFIPAPVAAKLEDERVNGQLKSFPDGPPSIADVHDGSSYLTLMVQAGGSGSTAAWALDITDTLNGAPAIDGPDPLWHKTIENAGNAFAKPAIVRIDNSTDAGEFQVILASGLPDGELPDDPGGPQPLTPHTHGRRVVGVNATTGVEQWYFDAICAVTSDITAFETDDDDTGILGTASTIDGFADRVVFADYCGYVYMLDLNNLPVTPGVATAIGPIDTLVADDASNNIKALFWTGTANAPTTDPLGSNLRRPIAGGIAARADDSTDVVLYFGTGGLEQFDPSLENMFYAVYAKNGAIRSKLLSPCVGGKCAKFYGGTVTTATQVIITKSTDPEVSAPNASCDTGTAEFILADLSDENANGLIDDNNTILTAGSGSVGAVFAANNAVYITLLNGEVAQIGEPSVTTPGSDTTQASSATDILKGEYMATSGWRQVLY